MAWVSWIGLSQRYKNTQIQEEFCFSVAEAVSCCCFCLAEWVAGNRAGVRLVSTWPFHEFALLFINSKLELSEKYKNNVSMYLCVVEHCGLPRLIRNSSQPNYTQNISLIPQVPGDTFSCLPALSCLLPAPSEVQVHTQQLPA